jgi:hypothetical protein
MTELPVIACSLGHEELAERRARWRALVAESLIERTETSAGVRLAFRSGAVADRELRELAALERECCAFARFEVRTSGGQLLLDVSAPPEGVGAVQAMFS